VTSPNRPECLECRASARGWGAVSTARTAGQPAGEPAKPKPSAPDEPQPKRDPEIEALTADLRQLPARLEQHLRRQEQRDKNSTECSEMHSTSPSKRQRSLTLLPSGGFDDSELPYDAGALPVLYRFVLSLAETRERT
jgi:hypothetical protein